MNGLIVLAAACEGYACPPGNKVPAGEVEVVRISQDLAQTGVDPMSLTWWALAGALAVTAGVGALITARRKQH